MGKKKSKAASSKISRSSKGCPNEKKSGISLQHNSLRTLARELAHTPDAPAEKPRFYTRPHAAFKELATGRSSEPKKEGDHPHISRTFLIAFIAAVACIFAFALIFVWKLRSPTVHEFPCATPECVAADKYLRSKLATDLQPCDNFYDYVCRSWFVHSGSFIEDAVDSFRLGVHNPILNGPRPEAQQFGMHLLFDFYRSCYHYMSATVEGGQNEAIERLGTWPRRAAMKTALLGLYGTSLSAGVSTIFTVGFVKVGQEELLHVSQGKSLKAKLVTTSRDVGSLTDYLMTVIRLMHAEDVEESHQEIVEIDAVVETVYSRPGHTDSLSFRDLCDLVPGSDVKEWIAATNSHLPPRHHQSEDSDILITGKEIILEVVENLRNRSDDIISLYSAMQLAIELMKFDYYRRYEVQNPFDRIVTCLRITRFYISYTWPYLTAKLAGNLSNYNLISSTFLNIKKAILESLSKATWMELPSRLDAEEKVQNVKLLMVQSSPVYLMGSSVDYRSVQRLPDDFIDSYIAMAELSARLRLDVFGESEHITIGQYQEIGTIRFLLQDNIAFVPTAMMIPPMFYPSHVENPFNYGTLGVLMGVAIASTVGPTGSKLMPDGTGQSWWTDKTWSGFRARMACLVEQYNRLRNNTDPPSIWVLDDLFQWTFSIRNAYNRYKKLSKRTTKTRDKVIYDQTFFLRACLLSCSFEQKAYFRLSPKYRCMLPLLNMYEFSSAFSCKPGSTMFPATRCVI